MRTNKQNQSPGKHWGHGEALTRGPAGGRAGQRLGWGRPRECQRCQPEPGFPPPSQPPVLCWTLASQRCPADLDACPPPCRSPGEGHGNPLQYSCLVNPTHFLLSCIGEGNGNLLQCSCLEKPRDGGAWWSSVYGELYHSSCPRQSASGMSHSYLTCPAGTQREEHSGCGASSPRQGH